MRAIVVGVDESPSSRLALRWALDEARLRGAELRVVWAWEFPFAATTSAPDSDGGFLPDVPSPEQSALSELAAAVAEAGGAPMG